MENLKGKRVGIISLGCARNTVDSEKFLMDMKSQGATVCEPEEASVVLVNTCGFTQEAKEESIGVILDLIESKKRGQIDKIVVCGCLAERYRDELRKSFKEVDAFTGIADFKHDADVSIRLTPAHRAYLKISEGCANRCSYCAIPLIKGPLRSRSEASILKEAQKLQGRGVQELIVIGQDITLFGWEKSFKDKDEIPLVKLLKKLLKATKIPWIRLLYLHPKRITPALIELFASEMRLCPYVDLPLQHINDRILKLMNRQISKKEIVRLIGRLRRNIPQAALRTSFITGFPSESEREFQELLDFIREVRFDRMGVFKYSREEGTKAYHFKGQLSSMIKDKRYNRLMSLQKEISKANLQTEVGSLMDILVDEKGDTEDIFIGRSRKDAPDVDGVVFLHSKNRLRAGTFVKSRIVDAYEYDLYAEVVE